MFLVIILKENKNLTHLQNNINKFNKQISNLQEVQQQDMKNYLALNDETLDILKIFISELSKKTVA